MLIIGFFLLDLLSHPIFQTHELVWEFLVVPSLDHALISSRTKLKRDHMIEKINDTYSPIVEGLEEIALAFKESVLWFLKLQGLVKILGSSSKRLGYAKKGKLICVDIRNRQFITGA